MVQNLKIYQYILQFCCIALVGLLCQSCAKNKLTSSWVDTSYHGPVTGPILVIGIFKDPYAHKIYEDSFVVQLRKAGVEALPSYTYDLRSPKPGKEKLQKVVDKSGASTILITHIVDEQSSSYQFPDKHYIYGSSVSWNEQNGYHSTIYEAVWGNNVTVEKTVATMEASLFDGKSGKCIWSVRSKSVNLKKLLRKDDEQLEELFIKDMKKHSIL